MELMPERSLPPPLTDTVAPDVVITTATTHKAGIEDINRTLWHWPRTQVLLITLDGHDSVLFGQRIHSTRLGELSPRELVDAIRAVVRHHQS